MTLPEFEREDRHYKPSMALFMFWFVLFCIVDWINTTGDLFFLSVAFVGTLGKLSASHVAHPREMVQVPHMHKDTDQVGFLHPIFDNVFLLCVNPSCNPSFIWSETEKQIIWSNKLASASISYLDPIIDWASC